MVHMLSFFLSLRLYKIVLNVESRRKQRALEICRIVAESSKHVNRACPFKADSFVRSRQR